MKKNIVIIVLVALVVMFGLFGFAQRVKSDQAAEEAIKQQGFAEEQRAATIAAQEQAISLQQQLDNCK